jgi:hypothetical protein
VNCERRFIGNLRVDYDGLFEFFAEDLGGLTLAFPIGFENIFIATHE